MEFSAQIAGAQVKSSGSSAEKKQEPAKTGLAERLREKLGKNKEKEAIEKGSTQFSEGVGYKII